MNMEAKGKIPKRNLYPTKVIQPIAALRLIFSFGKETHYGK